MGEPENGGRATLRDVMALAQRVEDKIDALVESIDRKLYLLTAGVRDDVEGVKGRLSALERWRWKIAGAAIAILFLLNAASQFLPGR